MYVALFTVFVVLAAVFIALAGRLRQAGLTRPVFFLVLVPVGLASAAFLKGALEASSAEYEGTLWFGKVRVSGPVAVFAMVVAAGIFLTPPREGASRQLVVRVHREGRPADLVTSGQVILFVGSAAFRGDISSTGEAVFRDIPDTLHSEPIQLIPQVPGYELAGEVPTRLPDGGVLSLPLRPREQKSIVVGTVLGPDQQPVSGAVVDLEHGLATPSTDALGHFRAELPRAPGTTVLVVVIRDGKVGHQGYYTIPNELTLHLQR